MSQVERIKEMSKNGYSLKAIQDDVGISYKTVRKYLEQEDFNEPLPVKRIQGKSKIHLYQDEIIALVESCKTNWKKQQITGRRVYDILKKNHGDLNVSYETVQRFIKQYKASLRLHQQLGYEELVWHAGEAQGDFGEADFLRPDGTIERLHYFQLSFPYSNMFYTQIFKGENCECVCQALKSIFEYLGKVPLVIIFDNATGIGKRIAGLLQESRLFTRFRLHYAFTSRYCNPDSGHEKGSVENSVGHTRRNVFTPLITIPEDIEAFNTTVLFSLCEDLKKDEIHYKKDRPIPDLMREDLAAMHELPATAMAVKNIVRTKTDAYGKFSLNNHHWYSLGAQYPFRSLLVETYAWRIQVYSDRGDHIETFDRAYGKEQTNTVHLRTLLGNLIYKPGSWPNSRLRELLGTDDPLCAYIDNLPTRNDRKNLLRLIQDIGVTFSCDTVLYACQDLIRHGQHLSRANIMTLSNRVSTFPTDRSNNCTGVDLAKFDSLLVKGASR